MGKGLIGCERLYFGGDAREGVWEKGKSGVVGWMTGEVDCVACGFGRDGGEGEEKVTARFMVVVGVGFGVVVGLCCVCYDGREGVKDMLREALAEMPIIC